MQSEAESIRAELEAEATSYSAALSAMRERTEQHHARVRELTERLRTAMERQVRNFVGGKATNASLRRGERCGSSRLGEKRFFCAFCSFLFVSEEWVGGFVGSESV